MLTSILIMEIDHSRHLWQLGRRPRPNLAKNLYCRGLTFRTQNKSTESTRNVNFYTLSSLRYVRTLCRAESNFHNSTTFHCPPKYRFQPKCGPESPFSYDRCHVWSIAIIKMDVTIYLSKSSWNRYCYSDNPHQDGSPQVSYI